MCTYIQRIDINWREMSHQRKRVLEYPRSISLQAKDWYNSEIKFEQIMEAIVWSGWPSEHGAAFCGQKGSWTATEARCLLSSFWWGEKSPELNGTIQKPLMTHGGCSSGEQLYQGTWKNQCQAGDEWEQLKLLNAVILLGGRVPHWLAHAGGAGGDCKGRWVTAGWKTDQKRISASCAHFIFQLLDLKTWA